MKHRAQHAQCGHLRIALVITSVLAVLSASCTANGQTSSTSAASTTDQDGSIIANASDAPTTCAEVVDDTLAAIQDFLDRLGDAATYEAPALHPVEVWVEAYADLHRKLAQLEAFVTEDISDEELEALAESVAGWQGVSAIETLSKEQALAYARQLFENDPDLLDVLDKDPSIIPRSIRLAVEQSEVSAIEQRLETTPGITDTIVRRVGVPDLALGLFGVGVAEPYLRQPTADAERLGCTDDLLEALRSRASELEPRGSAGMAFIETLNQ